METWIAGSTGLVGPIAAVTVEKQLKPLTVSAEVTFQVLEVATVPKFEEKDAVSPKSCKVEVLDRRIVLIGVSGQNGQAAKSNLAPIHASETVKVMRSELGLAMIHTQLNEVKLQDATVRILRPELAKTL